MGAVVSKFLNRLPVIWSILLIGLGLYIYRGFLVDNLISTVILISASTVSMFFVLGIWRKFVTNYADEIIHWTTEKSFFRKFIAGGSFSYYEYKEDIDKVGLFEPLSRFFGLLVAFIGISTSFANVLGLEPSSPTADLESSIIWSLLIFFVPILLTPIIPIIWAMEDLQLKAWNAKFKTNTRISKRYRARFNSFIAIGTLGAAFGLTRNPQLGYIDQIISFVELLLSGILILIYPIAVLTTLYYIYFRGRMVGKVRDKLNLPIAETTLIYRDRFGKIVDEDGLPEGHDGVGGMALGEYGENDKPSARKDDNGQEPSLPQRIGTGAANVVSKTGETITSTSKSVIDGAKSVGKTINNQTIGRLSKVFKGKNSDNNLVDERKIPKNDKKKRKKGGSSTEGLWDKDY